MATKDTRSLIFYWGCKAEVNEKDNVPTNYYIAKIRDDKIASKKIRCNDKDENLKSANVIKILLALSCNC